MSTLAFFFIFLFLNDARFFGKEHGEYDFAKKSISAVLEQLRKLEEEQEYLSKRVNKKAFNMVEQYAFNSIFLKGSSDLRNETYLTGLNKNITFCLKRRLKLKETSQRLLTLLLNLTRRKIRSS